MKLKKKGISIAKYIPVLVILLSLTIIIGSTFAYFTHSLPVATSTPVTFGKVELADSLSVEFSDTLMDVIPGEPIIAQPISVQLASGSKPAYIRAKISYTGDESMATFLNALRDANGYEFYSPLSNGAEWSGKQGNYVYLLDSTTGKPLVVNDTTSYTLLNSFALPTDLDQLEDRAQYMQSIQFHLAFQAIQADNLEDDTLEYVSGQFNLLFPESAEEAYSLSSNNNLSSLALVGATLSPSFSANTLNYTAEVANSVESVSVTATAADDTATVTGTGVQNLSVGENVINVVCTAEDSTTKTYSITITRANPAPVYNVTLQGNGGLIYGGSYNGEPQATITTADSINSYSCDNYSDPNWMFQGWYYNNGTSWQSVSDLSGFSSDITLKAQYYAQPEISIQTSTGAGSITIECTGTHHATTEMASAGYEITYTYKYSSSMDPSNIITAASDVSDSTYTITGLEPETYSVQAIICVHYDDGPGAVSNTAIDSSVNVEQGVLSSIADLMSIDVSCSDDENSTDYTSSITPNFDHEEENYTLTVPSSITTVSITAQTWDVDATVSAIWYNVNIGSSPEMWETGHCNINFGVTTGEYTVTITVVAPDGTQKTYSLVITVEE